MQSNHNKNAAVGRRTAPGGMPPEAPRPSPEALHGKAKPRDTLPEQKPVTDEMVTEKKPSLIKRVLLRILMVVLVVAAIALAYVFLLLGEPEEEALDANAVVEQRITMPMSALETPGEANTQSLADTFGQPVMSLYGGLSMQRARIYDTAFGGGFARRVTITYAFEDGAALTVESIRPTSALTLLSGSGYRLDATAMYALGGIDAAMMSNSERICVFGQSDTAAYAVICPASHADDLAAVLRQTTLITPTTAQ